MKKRAQRINDSFYYGWVIVLISAVGLFFSAPGQTYSISIFRTIYEQELGYSSTMLSVSYTFATVLSGTLLVFMGRFVDRFGQRMMMLIVGALLAVTAFYNSYVSNIIMIFIGFFLLRYFGQGSMVLIPNSLVPQWFEKKRALAISLMTLGGIIATMSIPYFNHWLIGTLGGDWRMAWRIWALAIALIFIPLVSFFVINRPENIGITVENTNNGDEGAAQEALAKIDAESFTLKQTLRTKEFWFMGYMSLIVSMFTTGVTFHFTEMMAVRGVGTGAAAFIIGLIAAPAFVMPFVARLLIDRVRAKVIFFITQSIIFTSMALLIVFVRSAGTAAFFILFYGSAVAAQQVALNTFWPNYFGRKHLGTIRGAAHVFMVIGSSLGPLPFGINYDLTGGFEASILVMMAMAVAGIVMALSVQKPEKDVRS